jgi:hypothetical protein
LNVSANVPTAGGLLTTIEMVDPVAVFVAAPLVGVNVTDGGAADGGLTASTATTGATGTATATVTPTLSALGPSVTIQADDDEIDPDDSLNVFPFWPSHSPLCHRKRRSDDAQSQMRPLAGQKRQGQCAGVGRPKIRVAIVSRWLDGRIV